MTLTYVDAASLAFGRRPFTTAEFRNRIGSNRAAKLLHELKGRGLVERMGRGKYRLLAPEERPDRRGEEWRRIHDVLMDAPIPKAWAGASAVLAWTHGRYRVGESPFLREFVLAISEKDAARWRTYLDEHGLTTEPRKAIGARIVLDPRAKLRVDHVEDEPVVPRDEVVKLIRSYPALYADAEALLAS